MGDFSDDYGGYDILGLYERRDEERAAQRSKLLTLPPKRPWRRMTEEERASFEAANPKTQEEWDELFNGIEAKLKEKNL